MMQYTTRKKETYFGGMLYHRVKGKYISADTPDAGPYYYRYKKPDGKVFTKCLETEDRYEAASIAKGIYLAFSKDKDNKASPQISEVWDRYEDAQQNISDSSMDDYRQIFRRFVKWTNNRAPKKYRGHIKYAEDVTDELCNIYAKEVCDSKTTGMRDLAILRGVWNLVFPHNTENPWDVGIKPKVKHSDDSAHSRMLTLDEARRFRESIRKEAEEWP